VFAVTISKSYTVPGDKRSRTNPGHGYPEHSVDYEEMRRFPTKEALEAYLLENERKTYCKDNISGIYRLQKLEAKTTLTVEVV